MNDERLAASGDAGVEENADEPRAFDWRPWVAGGVVVVATVVTLRLMGRTWWCGCGEFFLWADSTSQHSSGHLFDPYTFSHIAHGLIFALAFRYMPPVKGWLARTRYAWLFVFAMLIEAGWEVLENTPWVINRYRDATAALGYTGDGVINSMSDLVCCMVGFVFAMAVRWPWTVGMILAIEVLSLIAIRDNLTLNVLMLILPIEGIREWQLGG